MKWKVIEQENGYFCVLAGPDVEGRPAPEERLAWEGDAVDDHDALEQAFRRMPEYEDFDFVELQELERQAKSQFERHQPQGAPDSERRRE